MYSSVSQQMLTGIYFDGLCRKFSSRNVKHTLVSVFCSLRIQCFILSDMITEYLYIMDIICRCWKKFFCTLKKDLGDRCRGQKRSLSTKGRCPARCRELCREHAVGALLNIDRQPFNPNGSSSGPKKFFCTIKKDLTGDRCSGQNLRKIHLYLNVVCLFLIKLQFYFASSQRCAGHQIQHSEIKAGI